MVGDKEQFGGEGLGEELDQVLNSVGERGIVSYVEIRQKTGLYGAALDDGLERLEQMGLIKSQNVLGVIHYWKLRQTQEQKWYTVDEAARYLRVSRRTIYQLVKEKQLAPYRVGRAGHRRFKQGDIDAVMRKEDDMTDLTIRESALRASDDPVLAELWDNEKDAEYDRL